MDVRGFLDAAGLERQAEGPLQGGVAHGFGGRGGSLSSAAPGGKKQARMAMGFPLLPQELEGARRQGDVTIGIAFAGTDVQEPAFGINVRDLEVEAFAQSQTAGVNGAQADPMIQGGNRRQQTAHLGAGKHHRQFELGIGARQFQFMWPDSVEGLLPEQLDRADRLGAGLTGDFADGLEMDAILADVFGCQQVGRLIVELTELTHTGVVSLLCAGADGQKLKIIGEGF